MSIQILTYAYDKLPTGWFDGWDLKDKLSVKELVVMYRKFLLFSFLIFILGSISTLWVMDLFRALLIINLILLLKKENREIFEKVIEEIIYKIKPSWVTAYCCILCAYYFLIWITRFLGVQIPLWDEGLYLQGIHNFRWWGVPTITFHPDFQISYFDLHHTISLYLMTFLYWIFESPMIVPFYQALFALLPAVLLAFWSIQMNLRLGGLAFLLYFMSVNFNDMSSWPYAYHILGPSLLLMAYWFYQREKPVWWALSLFFLSFEKEEFSLVSIGFVIMVWADYFITQHRKKKFLFWSGFVLVFAILSARFQNHNTSWMPFSKIFGYLGQTPGEAFVFLIKNPSAIVKRYLMPKVMFYLTFFIGISWIWFKPQWKTFKFFLPVLPSLLANAFGLIDIHGHYSILINLGACVSFLMAVMDQKDLKLSMRRPIMMLIAIGTSLFLSKDTISRFFVSSLDGAIKTWEERIVLEKYQKESFKLCCESSVCGTLAARRYGYFAEDCFTSHVKKDDSIPFRFILAKENPLNKKISSLTSVQETSERYIIYFPVELDSEQNTP